MMQRVSNKTRERVILFITFALILITGDVMAYPSARRSAGMVWSGEAKGIILFGGLSPSDAATKRYEFDDTWRFTGLRWVPLYPENAPSPRQGMSMVYDSNRKRILLFGGGQQNEVLGDTWVFEEKNWTELAPPSSPPPRVFGAIAFDPLRDRVVLFGGRVGEARLFDTWEFDGSTWRLIQEDGPHVEVPTLVYDGARHETLMTGVENGAVVMYRYVDGSWSKIDPETLPDCVGQTQMVFREWNGTVISYGGLCASGGVSSDTWVWDGTNWTEPELESSAGPLYEYSLAYDPTRDQVLIYGGVGLLESNDTFRLAADEWIRLDTVYDPGPRTQFVLEPSLDGERLLFFGGQNSSSFFIDFWSLENLSWDHLSREGTPPSACRVPVGAVDPVRERLVVLCADSSTYEFDGATWTAKSTSRIPPARRWSMMAWDPVSRKIVMYGGYDQLGGYLNETWTYDGTTWTKLDLKKNQRPAARILSTMFVDPRSDRIMLIGGIGRPDFNSDFERYEDQWQFDGSKWVEMTPSAGLPQRYGAQVAVDPVNERVLVFGGKDANEKYLGDMWVWNGTSWSELQDGPAPAPRMNGRMAWDPSTQKVVLYGGFAGVYYSELWTFDGAWSRVEPDPLPRRPVRRPVQVGGSNAGSASVTPDPVRPEIEITGPVKELR